MAEFATVAKSNKSWVISGTKTLAVETNDGKMISPHETISASNLTRSYKSWKFFCFSAQADKEIWTLLILLFIMAYLKMGIAFLLDPQYKFRYCSKRKILY